MLASSRTGSQRFSQTKTQLFRERLVGIFVLIYISPSANANSTLGKLYGARDFDQENLCSVLPEFNLCMDYKRG